MAARGLPWLRWEEWEPAHHMVCTFGKQGEMDAGGVELSLLFSFFFRLGPMEDADGIQTYLVLTSSLKPFRNTL